MFPGAVLELKGTNTVSMPHATPPSPPRPIPPRPHPQPFPYANALRNIQPVIKAAAKNQE